MPVHQQCYGIVDIPSGDWICELCLNFGPEGRYLRCPLCTKRGGALKPTVLWADTQYFANLNPDYHEFLSRYCKDDKVRTAKLANSHKSHRLEPRRSLSKNCKCLSSAVISYRVLDIETSENHGKCNGVGHEMEHEKSSVSSHHGKGLKFDKRAMAHHFVDTSSANRNEHADVLLSLYYDAQNLPEYFTEEELKNEPQPEKVWAHITCCLFIPGLYFIDKENVTDIDGKALSIYNFL